jgi:AcrR family transcriptional regulator
MAARTPKRPRRKAKQDRAHDTVEVIVEAAARVLLERGYAAATTNRIARAAGVSVGTVYEYFANKDEVFDALIQREIAAIIEAVGSQPPDSDTPLPEILSHVLALVMQATRFGPELFRVLEQVPDAVFRRRLAAARETVIATVKALLESHRSELAVDDVDLAAFILVSASEGVGGNATREMYDDRLRAELATMFERYLMRRDD